MKGHGSTSRVTEDLIHAHEENIIAHQLRNAAGEYLGTPENIMEVTGKEPVEGD